MIIVVSVVPYGTVGAYVCCSLRNTKALSHFWVAVEAVKDQGWLTHKKFPLPVQKCCGILEAGSLVEAVKEWA
jgi:hypothetical protein